MLGDANPLGVVPVKVTVAAPDGTLMLRLSRENTEPSLDDRVTVSSCCGCTSRMPLLKTVTPSFLLVEKTYPSST